MAELKKYADIPELPDAAAPLHSKNEYTYIINAEKYQQTGELEVKRVLKKDLLPEASASYVFFKREGCHSYPLNDQDLSLKGRGYVGPFQMNNRACIDFLKHIKEKYPETKKYIAQYGTNGYLNFVKKYPDKEKLKEIIEEYALSGYYTNRPGKPNTLATNLAAHLKRTDEKGTPDATRLPLHVIAALPTGIIARGNGTDFNELIPNITEEDIDTKCISWIKSTLGANAYDQLKQVDYLTPEIMEQYKTMNLAGAENLQQKYNEQVAKKEQEMQQKFLSASKRQIFEPDALRVAPPVIDIKIPPTENQKKLEAKLRAKEAKRRAREANNKREVPKSSTTKELRATNNVNTLSLLRATHERD